MGDAADDALIAFENDQDELYFESEEFIDDVLKSKTDDRPFENPFNRRSHLRLVRKPEREKGIWIDKFGQMIDMRKMGDRHVINCILMMERRQQAAGAPLFLLMKNAVFCDLLDECVRRGLPLPHILGRGDDK